MAFVFSCLSMVCDDGKNSPVALDRFVEFVVPTLVRIFQAPRRPVTNCTPLAGIDLECGGAPPARHRFRTSVDRQHLEAFPNQAVDHTARESGVSARSRGTPHRTPNSWCTKGGLVEIVDLRGLHCPMRLLT